MWVQSRSDSDSRESGPATFTWRVSFFDRRHKRPFARVTNFDAGSHVLTASRSACRRLNAHCAHQLQHCFKIEQLPRSATTAPIVPARPVRAQKLQFSSQFAASAGTHANFAPGMRFACLTGNVPAISLTFLSIPCTFPYTGTTPRRIYFSFPRKFRFCFLCFRFLFLFLFSRSSF